MIKNERQYKITKNWVKKFSEAKKLLTEPIANKDPILQEIELGAVTSQILELKSELREYDRLKVRKTTPVKSMFDIGKALVMARIMKHWNHKQLAKKLNLKEQQIQRWEDDFYETCGLHTLKEIANALGCYSSTLYITIKPKP